MFATSTRWHCFGLGLLLSPTILITWQDRRQRPFGPSSRAKGCSTFWSSYLGDVSFKGGRILGYNMMFKNGALIYLVR